MSRMEIITRTERRRKWSEEQRAQILTECDQPDATIKMVAQRYDVAESLIYKWKRDSLQSQKLITKPLAFIHCGEIDRAGIPVTPSPENMLPSDLQHQLHSPVSDTQSGTIQILFATGERIVVDNSVNEQLLARVVRALRGEI